MKLCKRTFLLITTFFSLLFLFAGCVNLTEGYQGTELFPAQFNDGCHDATDTHNGFWLGVNTCAADFKLELHNRIRGHRVLRYTENTAPYDAIMTKTFISLVNTSYVVPTRFDVWDAYVIFAAKGANPYKSGANCPADRVLDWYDYQCYQVPSEVMSQNSGGQQQGAGSDPIGSAVANFGTSGLYNREHTWSQSWFAAGATPVNNPGNGSYCYNGNSEEFWPSSTNPDFRAYTDLHHLVPARAAVNGARLNFAPGIVGTTDSANFPRTSGFAFGLPNAGAMPGFPGATGNTAKVFTPPPELRGDFARNYFYMATRYYSEDTCWQSNNAVTRANINTWLENLLRQWHSDDPVSAEERTRNNWIERVQGNRNPFIDHPEWVEKIADF